MKKAHGKHRQPTNRRKLLAAIGVIAFSLSGIGVLSSGALFNSSKTAADNQFTNGTLDVATAPTATVFNAANLAPGDVVVAPLLIRNTGSLPMEYSINSTTSGNLAQYMGLQVRSDVTDCSAAGFTATGTDISAHATFGPATNQVLFGNPAQGAQVGDRPIPAGSNETLCFKVDIPLSRSNEVAGQTATMKLTVNAEQTDPLATNLAWDPSFEQCKWLNNLSAAASTSCVSASDADSGTKVQRTTVTQAGAMNGPWWDAADAIPGKTYTVSLLRRGTDTTKRSLNVDWLDQNSTRIVSTVTVDGSGTSLGNGWIRYRGTVTAPAEAAHLRLTFYGNSTTAGGVMDLDSLMVSEGSTPYAYADATKPGWVQHGPALGSCSTPCGPTALGPGTRG